MTNSALLWTALGSLLLQSPAVAQQPAMGIAGTKAPNWGVAQWINLPQDKQAIDVADFKGKVVYLLCFQSWCPGCHARGFPTLLQLISSYDDTDDVAFVAVQTTFEGFAANSAQRAWETARRYKLDIPIGHDGSAQKRSTLMQRYRTGGTPWVIIIDKQGIVRRNGFHVPAQEARKMIDSLREESLAAPANIETLPQQRGGQDRVGKRFPKLNFGRWIGVEEQPLEPKRVRATLYRWWTDTCPYCRSSLPAIEKLRREYASKGLRIVCVYHPKPPRKVSDEAVIAVAKRYGYHGPVAVDADWSRLTKAYLSSGQRAATSVTFLVDERGVTRFLHPGPVFFASEDPQHARENADYQLLKRAIEALLVQEGEQSDD